MPASPTLCSLTWKSFNANAEFRWLCRTGIPVTFASPCWMRAVQQGRPASKSSRKSLTLLSPLPGSPSKIDQKFYKWAAITGALLLSYDEVAFDPEAAITRIENCFGLKIDREEVKRHAFEEAFTQKNKGRRN